MGIKKPTSLRTAFWRFLFMLLISLAGAVMIPFALLTLCVTLGAANYADYSEIQAKELAPIIAATPDLSEVQIPGGIKYALLDKDYRPLKTTLDNGELEQAIFYATTGTNDKNLRKGYQLVIREKEYVVLQYYIGSQFTNDWMNKHLPSPDILLFVLIGTNCILVCIFLTAGFAKNLRRQLTPLFEATARVSKQNLDFEIGHSKIKEFEEVLLSFSDMKDSLKTSLEQQWKAEQTQREQIAALAHDLKTPLTIIQGNADLISETTLDEAQRLYAGHIISSCEQMQLYMKTLIEISRAVAGYSLHMEDIDFPCYVEEIASLIRSLCQTKSIRLQMTMTDLPAIVPADKMLLERAITNVVNNALDYSPKNGTIHISFSCTGNNLQISVTDEGKGFSQEALSHAWEQFYMADRSRSSNLHYGMGLYITKSIVEQHHGELILENETESGGAKVTIKIGI